MSKISQEAIETLKRSMVNDIEEYYSRWKQPVKWSKHTPKFNAVAKALGSSTTLLLQELVETGTVFIAQCPMNTRYIYPGHTEKSEDQINEELQIMAAHSAR